MHLRSNSAARRPRPGARAPPTLRSPSPVRLALEIERRERGVLHRRLRARGQIGANAAGWFSGCAPACGGALGGWIGADSAYCIGLWAMFALGAFACACRSRSLSCWVTSSPAAFSRRLVRHGLRHGPRQASRRGGALPPSVFDAGRLCSFGVCAPTCGGGLASQIAANAEGHWRLRVRRLRSEGALFPRASSTRDAAAVLLVTSSYGANHFPSLPIFITYRLTQ